MSWSNESDAERSAAEARKRLQQLQRVASVGFWELDPRRGNFTASDQIYRICGLDPREGPEPPEMIARVAHPYDAARFETTLAEALAGTADHFTIDLRVVRPDGEVRWVNSSGEVSRDEHGVPLCIIGTLLDITDRKRVEDSLRASELRLRVLHRLGDAIRSEAHVDEIMSTALRLLGEALRASRCVFCHVDEDGDGLTIPDEYRNGCASLVGRTRLSNFGATAVSVLSRGDTLVIRDVRRELGADEIPCYLAAQVEANIACALLRNGVPRALMAVHQTTPRDWTEPEIELIQEFTERCWTLIEQRAAEAKLLESQTLAQIASRIARVGGWRITLPDVTISWSDEVCAIHEVPVGTKPTLDQAIGFFAPEHRELMAGIAQRALQEGAPFDIEARLITTSGRSAWVRTVGKAERATTGAIISLHGALQDITPWRNLEEQLRQSQKMEAVGRLAGGVAHDFNNLLSVVLGCSSLLLAELPSGARARNEVEEIIRAGERASKLTRQLLAFSRQQVLQPRIADWNQILRGMETMLQRLLGADITLDLLLAPDLGQMLADPSQLEQVVMNLLVNARDAMPNGGTLTIETANVDLEPRPATMSDLTPGRYVVLIVSDTGIGMSADTRSRIFEPFFTTKEKAKGTGLGLSTVHGIVTQSGGHASVESAPGEGTTFRVFLPRVDTTAQTAVKAEALSSAPLGGSETILVVEDEEQVLHVIRSILRHHGYTVLEAQNAGEAFMICERHPRPIDVLLTDVVMPRMSGRELAERVASMHPGMRVIYMSGYTEDTTLHHGVVQSGMAFLQKPITTEALLRMVRAVLGQTHATHARA